jgi:hypothetical protein
MSHLLKHKVLLLAATFGLFLFLVIPTPPVSAVSAPPDPRGGTPSPTQPVLQTEKCNPKTEVLMANKHSCCPKGVKPDAESCLFAKYINPTVNLLSAAVGLVVVVGIIVGAIQFSTSAGDPQKAASGKKHIQNALIGLLMYLLLFGFLQFITPGGLLNAT